MRPSRSPMSPKTRVSLLLAPLFLGACGGAGDAAPSRAASSGAKTRAVAYAPPTPAASPAQIRPWLYGHSPYYTSPVAFRRGAPVAVHHVRCTVDRPEFGNPTRVTCAGGAKVLDGKFAGGAPPPPIADLERLRACAAPKDVPPSAGLLREVETSLLRDKVVDFSSRGYIVVRSNVVRTMGRDPITENIDRSPECQEGMLCRGLGGQSVVVGHTMTKKEYVDGPVIAPSNFVVRGIWEEFDVLVTFKRISI